MSLSSQVAAWVPQIESRLRDSGFERYGFAELTTPVSIAIYEQWLKDGLHGDMAYLERHLPQKKDPTLLMARARSAIVVALDYVPHPAPSETWPLSDAARVALYARGRDYHHFIRERLNPLIETLQSQWPEEAFACYTDSAPVLERDLAVRAGLGWVGKNTCVLSRQAGSLFFIAEIYTTLELPTAKIEVHDHCGTCTRCLDACPTGALKAPRVLDARACISYLTIESRQNPPIELRDKMQDWLFGCDICQTVCPWNLKLHGRDAFIENTITDDSTIGDEMSNSTLDTDAAKESSTGAHRKSLLEDLRFLLTSQNRKIEKIFQGTPLARAGGVGLKRNALVVAGNLGLHELRPEIETLKDHPKLGELAFWTLSKITP